MGGLADTLKNMGGISSAIGGGSSGGTPFTGVSNPFSGMGGMNGMTGGADSTKNTQKMMSNPKVREITMKAQSNTKIMSAVVECMWNPTAFAK